MLPFQKTAIIQKMKIINFNILASHNKTLLIGKTSFINAHTPIFMFVFPCQI